jgi:hypothetical protein
VTAAVSVIRLPPAARAVANARGLAQAEANVLYSGSNVLVHLRPALVVARVMTRTVALHDDPQEWLEREVSVLSCQLLDPAASTP